MPKFRRRQSTRRTITKRKVVVYKSKGHRRSQSYRKKGSFSKSRTSNRKPIRVTRVIRKGKGCSLKAFKRNQLKSAILYKMNKFQADFNDAVDLQFRNRLQFNVTDLYQDVATMWKMGELDFDPFKLTLFIRPFQVLKSADYLTPSGMLDNAGRAVPAATMKKRVQIVSAKTYYSISNLLLAQPCIGFTVTWMIPTKNANECQDIVEQFQYNSYNTSRAQHHMQISPNSVLLQRIGLKTTLSENFRNRYNFPFNHLYKIIKTRKYSFAPRREYIESVANNGAITVDANYQSYNEKTKMYGLRIPCSIGVKNNLFQSYDDNYYGMSDQSCNQLVQITFERLLTDHYFNYNLDFPATVNFPPPGQRCLEVTSSPIQVNWKVIGPV